jgi:protein-tyrosine-phosphatase
VLAAEASHADEIRASHPAAAHKVRLLSEFATPAHRGRDIGDPYGRTPGHYRTSFEEIRECIEGLVRALARDG